MLLWFAHGVIRNNPSWGIQDRAMVSFFGISRGTFYASCKWLTDHHCVAISQPYGGVFPQSWRTWQPIWDNIEGDVQNSSPLSSHKTARLVTGQAVQSQDSPSPQETPNKEDLLIPPPTLVSSSTSWGVVVGELERLGALRAQECVEKARQNSPPPTPELLLAICSHYAARPGAWGVGALVYRCGRARAGQSPGDLWPPQAVEYCRAIELETSRLQRQERSEAVSDPGSLEIWHGLSEAEQEAVVDRTIALQPFAWDVVARRDRSRFRSGILLQLVLETLAREHNGIAEIRG